MMDGYSRKKRSFRGTSPRGREIGLVELPEFCGVKRVPPPRFSWAPASRGQSARQKQTSARGYSYVRNYAIPGTRALSGLGGMPSSILVCAG
jgi:hypothetical protein